MISGISLQSTSRITPPAVPVMIPISTAPKGPVPKLSALLVPTAGISLSYFILEQLTSSLKFDGELNKNFRVLGPQGTSKSVILSTFAQRSQEQFDSLAVPMSSYLSFERLR